MYEVVTADGESVAVAAHLPHIEAGVCHFDAGGYCRSASVNGIHAISGHVMRQTTATSDAADNGDILRRHTDLCQRLMQVGQEEMVSATRAPTRLPLLIILCCITHNTFILLFKQRILRILRIMLLLGNALLQVNSRRS